MREFAFAAPEYRTTSGADLTFARVLAETGCER
ncbi:hypothetical protein V1291_004720 [Nitrobacteraceae bacterium AZCC 1564]